VAEIPTAHLDHDTILVAALAAGDLADLPRADAEALVAACTECATLHADLVAIATATHALPAPIRTRDYRLTAEQAERLRPSGIRGWLAAFGSSRLAVSRPLAVAFTTLGIAGLLLSAIPAGGPMGMLAPIGAERPVTGTPAVDDGATVEVDGSPVPAYGAPSAAPVTGASPEPGGDLAGEPAASGTTNVTGGEPRDATAAPSAGPGAEAGAPSWLAILSVALLATGLGLFIMRFAAGRLGAG